MKVLFVSWHQPSEEETAALFEAIGRTRNVSGMVPLFVVRPDDRMNVKGLADIITRNPDEIICAASAKPSQIVTAALAGLSFFYIEYGKKSKDGYARPSAVFFVNLKERKHELLWPLPAEKKEAAAEESA